MCLIIHCSHFSKLLLFLSKKTEYIIYLALVRTSLSASHKSSDPLTDSDNYNEDIEMGDQSDDEMMQHKDEGM